MIVSHICRKVRDKSRCLSSVILVLLLTGCGALDTHQARDPWGPIISSNVPDLISCTGKPDAVQQTGPDTAILQWTHQQSDQGISVTIPVLAAVKIGGGGGCVMVATVLRDGTVADVAFPGSYTTGLFAPPYSECGPVVSECLRHMGATMLPVSYDAFRWVLPGAGKP